MGTTQLNEPDGPSEVVGQDQEQAAQLVDKAVELLGGSQRPGQRQMAKAVQRSLGEGQHLLVQAGTGVGKTLAYLLPALAQAVQADECVVVATATLALQRQIMEKDLPLALEAVKDQLDRQPVGALLMGRANYLCRAKLAGDYPDQDEVLFDLERHSSGASSSGLAAEVRQLHRWAKKTESGQRESFPGGVSARAWRQVSVNGLQCMGPKCRFVTECFAEQARERASAADLVVTNHAMVALGLAGQPVLPPYGAMVIDEAHQLTASLTNAYTDELSLGQIERAVKALDRLKVASGKVEKAGQAVAQALDQAMAGWFRAGLPEDLGLALASLRTGVRAGLTALVSCEADDASRQQVQAELEQLLTVCDRLAESQKTASSLVVWLTRPKRSLGEGDPVLYVAPLEVASKVRQGLLDQATTILTSATLQVGGSFDAPASAIGLELTERDHLWRGLEVESPFDFAHQAILYVAKHLPAPDREGRAAAEQHEVMARLIEASNGGALGLFSSQKAAERAAEAVGGKVDFTVLCQGETSLGALVEQFIEEPETCLFGTLSLWQGLDAPGPTCRLVMIDRLPFPRPDEPMAQARTQAANQAGRNGFMEVAASHAAMLLAQGVGRLIRRSEDRGVVAVLDSRLATAGYRGLMLAGLPPMWRTDNLEKVISALERLA